MASIIAPSAAAPTEGCEVSSYVSPCNFTVICNRKTTEVRDKSKCAGDPYVTLVVMNSAVDQFNEYFFRVFDFRYKVKELIAIDNIWTLLKGSSFNYFPNAVHLDLSENRIEHISGSAFLKLDNMKLLNLSRNIIESVDYSAFSMNNNGIEELDLSYNRYNRISGEFRFLDKLRTLHLEHNQLTTIPHDAFEYSVNIANIYLQHNRLTSLSSCFKSLPKLTTLDLSYNLLTTLTSNDFSSLTPIVNFNVSHNKLTSIEPDSFSKLTHFKKADFSFNAIEMTIGENMFVNNRELNYLNLHHNKIAGVHSNAFKNCHLQYLNLDENNIVGNVPNILPAKEIDESSSEHIIPEIQNRNTNKDTTESSLTTIDEVNQLEQEIQAIHSELDNLNSVVANLTLTLNKYSDKLYNIYEHI